jgi:hypothetical protein
MTHMITENELNEWLRRPQWQVYASSASQGGYKRLEVDSADGTHVFRVTANREVIFLGADKSAAVAAFNEAR